MIGEKRFSNCAAAHSFFNGAADPPAERLSLRRRVSRETLGGDPLTEEQLVKALRRGELSALEALMDRYTP